MADQDSKGSLRIRGCDLYSIPLTFLSGTTNPSAPFGASLIGPFWAPISPATISARVAAIEEMFQWYNIRRLRVVYSPTVGTSQAGTVAVGISTDWDLQTAITSPTQQQVLELQPSMIHPLWQTNEMTLVNRGTKLYECYLSTESGENRFQAIIGASATGIPGTTPFGFGQLFIEYEIDFYQQSPLLSSVDIDRRRTQHGKFIPYLQRYCTLKITPSVKEEKEENKQVPTIQSDDFDVVSPRYVPTPSKVVGGSLYGAPTKSLTELLPVPFGRTQR